MAKRHGLSALAIEHAKPGPTRREISDEHGGLFLVVQPSGTKSWAVRYRFNGRPQKLTLGPWPALSLAAARKMAGDARLKVEQGIDPAAEKRLARDAARDREGDTVEHCAGQFIELHCKRRLRTWRTVERIFQVEVLPRWQGRTVHAIRKRDVITLIETVAADRPVMSNRTFAWLRAFFNWLVERDVLVASPCTSVKRQAKEHARERVLDEAEIVALWRAADADVIGPFLKTLLLLGQRRGETAAMRWSEIDKQTRTWTIPKERTKNAKGHTVPLPKQVLKIIEAMPQVVGDDRVFASCPDLLGFDQNKKRIDLRMQPTTPWVVHDLRRTMATGLQRLGVRLEVTEATLNHTSGSRAGIVGIYQRHDWADEKRAALQAWADRVEQLVTGKSGVVRLLRG
jgi:integrase